jgi:hypothetical protein
MMTSNNSEIVINAKISYIDNDKLMEYINYHKKENSPSFDSVVIINYGDQILNISSIKAEFNISIISNTVSFDKDCIINLTNNSSPRIRKNNNNSSYGFAGYFGFPGYNFSITCNNHKNIENISFISTGSKGGDGCDGNPGGESGKGGDGGKLIINKKVIKNGDKGPEGNPGKDIVTNNRRKNSIGHGEFVTNNYGLESDISKYNYLIHKGIHDLKIKELDPGIKSLLFIK